MQQALNARSTLVQTHNWANTLVIGTIGAALALSGDTITFPTPHGVAALALLLVALVRFFVRACIESNLLRNHIDLCHHIESQVIRAEPDWDVIASDHQCMLTERRPRIGLLPLAWRTAKQAFLWPALILLALIWWGLRATMHHPIAYIGVGFAAVATICEAYWYYTHFRDDS